MAKYNKKRLKTDALQVVHEDNHLLIIDKPASLLSQADRTGAPDALEQAKDYIKKKYNKPGNVYIGLVQRLDRNVSGLMIFARTSKAAARLSEDIRNHQIQKNYHALLAWQSNVDARPGQKGSLEDWLWKNKQSRRAELLSEKKVEPLARIKKSEAKRALLDYCIKQVYLSSDLPYIKSIYKNGIENKNQKFVLVKIRLHTGRFHQIRVQLAKHLGPIVGDTKYESKWRIPKVQLCLHCSELLFLHPVKKTSLHLHSPLPKNWRL